MRLVTQNVRGLTPEKLEMIIHTMKDRGIHAAALQETLAAAPGRVQSQPAECPDERARADSQRDGTMPTAPPRSHLMKWHMPRRPRQLRVPVVMTLALP